MSGSREALGLYPPDEPPRKTRRARWRNPSIRLSSWPSCSSWPSWFQGSRSQC